MKVLGIVGSLRKNSFNRSLINAFVAQKPHGVEMQIADIGILPHYNQDDESSMPESVQTLKTQIETADVIIVATPEYNRSIPGVLKNAIDWISRPYGQNSLSGKRALVIGASTGPIGTAVAQYDLKKMLLVGDAQVFGQPEFYLGMAESKFDREGNLTDEETKRYIDKAWTRITE